MKIKQLAVITTTIAAAAMVQAVAPSAQAAVLGTGSATCANVSFSFNDCAGYFDGNDKQGDSGLSNLNSLFGEGWTFVGDSDSNNPLISFTSGGNNSTAGSARTNLTGAGAIAVKAGNSYALYTIEDLASFDWSTAGVKTVGKKGNTPELSHLSLYRQANPVQPPAVKEIPEPSMLLGLVGLVGLGIRSRREDA